MGVPARVLDNWAMETLVRSWVYLHRHGEFLEAARQIAQVGRERWGGRWEWVASQIERADIIENMWYVIVPLLVYIDFSDWCVAASSLTLTPSSRRGP